MKTIAFLLVLASFPLGAQWLNYPDPRTPRNADGTPDLTAPAPTLAGKPDLTGLWRMAPTPPEEYEQVMGDDIHQIQIDLYDVTKHAINVFWGISPDEVPMRPAAAGILKSRMATQESIQALCLPSSIPLGLFTFTFKIIQTPQELIQLDEYGDPPRQVYTDGRELPVDPNPSWMGYSVGSWEEDTLVVETNGLNDRGWLDLSGHPRSESMHITERYHRRDFGHMDVEISFDDPIYYTRPFSIRTVANLIPDSDILEFVCDENEQDLQHLGN